MVVALALVCRWPSVDCVSFLSLRFVAPFYFCFDGASLSASRGGLFPVGRLHSVVSWWTVSTVSRLLSLVLCGH